MKRLNEKAKSIIGLFLLVGFAVCIYLGYSHNEAETVLSKAINICLECIGIG